MLTLGWTGGVASGKTTALELLGKIARLDVFEADRLGHKLLREPWIRDAVVELCGRDILDGGGEIERGRLGRMVFADRELLVRYNNLIHPPLIESVRAAVEEARNRSDAEAFVVDAALIFEWGIGRLFDAVVAVRAAQGLALRRLLREGLTEIEARQRLNSQLREEVKVQRADFVIINDNDLEALERRVWFLWEHQLAPLKRARAT
ncbi:MAG: dephospho-CoA kinase [Candidatus Coatesbacteria bacterium RBG_13_66_14]|uniref:Dephospho-CoA kinase n=1 Tax=Candidatus Coatesbacteria bacterium RBG_13_66_14 TaxID=1817816 RepID=A0A1F5F3S2_9BACT|nr:MAG: dephospho-CoA kinase [Candidatus Coatesbacteria bacterium RBG_13_66_14]